MAYDKYPFDTLLLSWRRASGDRRIIVGRLELDAKGEASFVYEKEGVAQALELGFVSYPGLPLVEPIPQDLALDLFYRRLINTERNDARRILDFLAVDPERIDDKLYLLGITGAKTATDMFEFLPVLKPMSKPYEYVTEIAGLRYYKVDFNALQENQELVAVREPENSYDSDAVRLESQSGVVLGYIKQGITNVFQENAQINVFVHRVLHSSTHQSVHIRLVIK